MLIQSNVMTVDELYTTMDDDPFYAFVNMEFESRRCRARIFRPLNMIEFGMISDIYGRKMKTMTVSCYQVDEDGNRLSNRGQAMFNDDKRYINPEDENDLEFRFYGNMAALWLVPRPADLSVVAIDWTHPSFIS